MNSAGFDFLAQLRQRFSFERHLRLKSVFGLGSGRVCGEKGQGGISRLERRLPDHHRVETDPKAPDVDPRALVIATHNDLGGHIGGGAAEFGEFFSFAFENAEAEIAELDVALDSG